MKSIRNEPAYLKLATCMIALILAPAALLASCEHKCNAEVLEAYCPAKNVETPMVEYDGHLWKAIMLEHSPDCGCDEMKEDTWPNYVPQEEPIYKPEDGNEGDSYEPYRKFREDMKKEPAYYQAITYSVITHKPGAPAPPFAYPAWLIPQAAPEPPEP